MHDDRVVLGAWSQRPRRERACRRPGRTGHRPPDADSVLDAPGRVLDTETTGLEPKQGHRIIELGCIELVDRRFTQRRYHQFLCPDRDIDAAAQEVHGNLAASSADKPKFAEIAEEFLEFVDGAELIIHNAPFDTGFLDYELGLLGRRVGAHADRCRILDTLVLARERHPGQKNSLDALCSRYQVNNTHRVLHGALLDAEILADVYLAMTGGQVTLELSSANPAFEADAAPGAIPAKDAAKAQGIACHAAQEQQAHAKHCAWLDEASEGRCVWLGQETERDSRRHGLAYSSLAAAPSDTSFCSSPRW